MLRARVTVMARVTVRIRVMARSLGGRPQGTKREAGLGDRDLKGQG